MKIGNPLDRDTNHGPQNHLAHLQKLLEYCQRGVEEGATLVCGGKQVPRPGQRPADREQVAWPLGQCLGPRPLQSGSQTSALPSRISGVESLAVGTPARPGVGPAYSLLPAGGQTPACSSLWGGRDGCEQDGVAGCRDWPVALQELGGTFPLQMSGYRPHPHPVRQQASIHDTRLRIIIAVIICKYVQTWNILLN